MQGIGNAVMGGLGCGIGGLVGGALLGMNLGKGWAPVWGVSAAVVAGLWAISWVGPLAWSRMAVQGITSGGAAASPAPTGKSLKGQHRVEEETQLVGSPRPTEGGLRSSVDATVHLREVSTHPETKDA
jgi:hypothetical protein